MKAYSSKEIIKILELHGWFIRRISGSHHQFYHSIKKGYVTVPHPKKSLSIGTIKSIFKQAGIEMKEGVRL